MVYYISYLRYNYVSTIITIYYNGCSLLCVNLVIYGALLWPNSAIAFQNELRAIVLVEKLKNISTSTGCALCELV